MSGTRSVRKCICGGKLTDGVCVFRCPPANGYARHKPVGVRVKPVALLTREEASAGERRAGNTRPYEIAPKRRGR